MPDAEHDGISMSNFTIGKKKENSSVAFGKVAVGNELLGIAFFRSDAHQSYKEAGSETCVSGYTQASLSRPARLVSLAMQQSCRLHNGKEVGIIEISRAQEESNVYNYLIPHGVPCHPKSQGLPTGGSLAST